jgi:excisionase family DNA binding protein
MVRKPKQDGLQRDSPSQDNRLGRRLVDIHEIATYTGMSVHTLYTMVSQRRIPYVKVGRLTKFDLALIDNWLAEHTVIPVDFRTRKY